MDKSISDLKRKLIDASRRYIEHFQSLFQTKELTHRRPCDPNLVISATNSFSDPRSSDTIAIVGPAPWEKTGIGKYCYLLAREGQRPVDYFATAADAQTFLDWKGRIETQTPTVRLLPLDSLIAAATEYTYAAVIVMIGNSYHLLGPWQAGQTLAREAPECLITYYVHEPFLFNLLWEVNAGSQRAVTASIQSAYPGQDSLRFTRPSQFDNSLSSGMFGARPLFSNVRAGRIVTNSSFASDILQAELSGTPLADRIETMFHPIFPTDAVSHPPDGTTLKIGSFGIASSEKMTDRIIESCNVLKTEGRSIRLVLAGYNVEEYVLSLPERPEFLSVVDAPSDSFLEQLIADVDVAVQLRRFSRGETSGIVSQLIAAEKPVVVSDIGAFQQYSDFLTMVSPQIGIDELAHEILNAPEQFDRQKAEKFRAEHSAAELLSQICNLT